MVSAGILVYDTFTTFMNVINKSEEIKENGRKKTWIVLQWHDVWILEKTNLLICILYLFNIDKKVFSLSIPFVFY